MMILHAFLNQRKLLRRDRTFFGKSLYVMRLKGTGSVLSSGWFRLWIVAVAMLSVVVSAIAAYTIWGEDACYRYVSISTKRGFVSVEDMELIDRLQEEANSRVYCGSTQYSMLITLEQLAKKGLVAQIGIQWREPRGWTYSDFEVLDILESRDINAETLIRRVHEYVRDARVRSVIPWGISVVVVSLAVLLVGLGVAWVRRGFQRNEGK